MPRGDGLGRNFSVFGNGENAAEYLILKNCAVCAELPLDAEYFPA